MVVRASVPFKAFARAANPDPIVVTSVRGHDWPRRRPWGYRRCDLDRCAQRRRWKNNCDCEGGFSAALIMPQSPGVAGLPLASRPATASWARPASRFPRRVSRRVPGVQLARQAPPSPASLSRSPTRPASFSRPPQPRVSQCRQVCRQGPRGTLLLITRADSGHCSCRSADFKSRGAAAPSSAARAS